jgi:hypothetical protein
MRITSLDLRSLDGVGENTDGKYAMRIALLLFLCSALGSTCSAAEAVSGPFFPGDCVGPHLKLEESWGKFFRDLPDETSISSKRFSPSEKVSPTDLRFYSGNANYEPPMFLGKRQRVPFFSAYDEPKPSFDWRCKRYIFDDVNAA